MPDRRPSWREKLVLLILCAAAVLGHWFFHRIHGVGPYWRIDRPPAGTPPPGATPRQPRE